MTEETPEEKQKRESIASLKKDAKNTSDFANRLAGITPSATSGMSVEDFKNKWISGFESGWIDTTQKPDDLPYELSDKSLRPKVIILAEGKELPKSSVSSGSANSST